MSTYEFWEVLTRPRGQIRVYTRNCQLQLWEWRTGLLSLWTNLSRALVMSKCPQARSTGWCWQVNRFWAWAGGGISDLQTLPVFPPSFPGSSHSKSQSTFLIISACWLWTGDRDQHGDETRRAGGIRLQAGRRTKLLTSFCSSATNSFREKKKIYASSLNFLFLFCCLFSPFCRNCSHWSHNLPNSTTPFPLSCDVSSACDVDLENRNECFHQCLSQSTVTDSQKACNTFFLKEWIIVIDEGKTSIASSLDSHSILLKVFCCHLLFVICVPKGCTASTGSWPSTGLGI